MSGMDVLRERIARALWEHRYPGVEQAGPLADLALMDADAVIAALGLAAVYGAQQDEGIVWGWEPDVATVRREWPGLPVVRSYVTPWERIEDDA